MIFLYLIAGICAVLNFIFQLLPPSTFLALPAAAYDAVGTVGGWTSYFLGLAGTEVKATLLQIIPIIIAVNIAVILWGIVRKWKAPIVGRYITE